MAEMNLSVDERKRSLGCAHQFRPMYPDGASQPNGPVGLQSMRVESCGIPHLAKNEPDVGHPQFCCWLISQA
jgi:hypothetical protein